MRLRLPSVQRKLVYVVFAVGLSSLVYLLYSTANYEASQQSVLATARAGGGGEGGLLGSILAKVRPKNTTLKKEPVKDPYAGPENAEQRAVVEAFQHAWRAYKTYAWGHDELKPLSKGWREWFGTGVTIVDSLDTMWIMGLKEEFREARDWVASSLNFDADRDVQLFEIVIRVLGGLMSAYYLSGDEIFLQKSQLLADNLEPCFKSPNHVPCRHINLKRGSPTFDEISTAEVGTLQMEYIALARALGKDTYQKAALEVSQHIHGLAKLDGLVPCFLNPQTGQFRGSSAVSMGASADSYYEYLLKQWLQTGKTLDWLKEDYLEAMAGMRKHLYRTSEPSKLYFVGSLFSMHSKGFKPEMEHLACFLPGTLVLGYLNGLGGEEHLQMAANLTRTCYEMYRSQPTGLSPEVAVMNMNSGNSQQDISINWGSHYNLQRPEAVESLFYLYRATHDPRYRDWGWKIFQAFEKHTRVENGYASISNVNNAEHTEPRDKMETFYLAETLKYLYLLFSDNPDFIPLDKFVFNTEAHPLPIYKS